jgi:hypothetical protein
MKNDGFEQQTLVDRPISSAGLETCGVCNGGGCIVGPANRSGRFTICRST